jgi:leishmanolysin
MIHELTHVLGFSQNLYSSWRSATGASPVGRVNIRQKQTSVILTPRVVNYVKRYFNCPGLNGAELEDNGSSGSAGSHWERRVFGNEVMTASVISNSKYSALTMALLEDSGWYKPDYAQAQAMVFGRDHGCAFVTEDCINRNTKKARFPEFCDTPNQQMCTFDHTTKGSCLIAQGQTRYDYFGNGYQAADSFADECPSVMAQGAGDCRLQQAPSRHLPEAFGPNSRCFAGTIIDPGFRFPPGHATLSGCYNHQCQGQKLFVQVGQNMIPCPIGGGQTGPIPGYNGFLICPHEKYICNANVAINPNFIAL